MPHAVRFDEYGGLDVLHIADVAEREPGEGEVRVRVVSAGTNPGENAIREGAMHEQFPATFPSGQGSDFAGIVDAVGAGVAGFSVGDAVLGWSDERNAQAQQVIVPAGQLTLKPDRVGWDAAGSLAVVGFTALSLRDAAQASEGDAVVVSAAAGGVGVLTVQLLRLEGVRVIALASGDHHGLLRGYGAVPLDYHADDLAEQIRAAAPSGIVAMLDASGEGYIELGLELGIPAERIYTIIDFAGAEEHGTPTTGQVANQSADKLAELATLIEQGNLQVPVQRTFPLDRVRDAYRELAEGHTAGKIVLHVSQP